MLHELPPDQWTVAAPVLAQFQHHLEVQSLLCGRSAGRVWVDRPEQPRIALAWIEHRILLAGDSTDTVLSQAVGDHFTHVFYPESIRAGKEMFTFFFEPHEWLGQVDVLLPDKHPIRSDRQYYEISTTQLPNVDWHALLPPGYTIRKVDEALLAETSLGRLDALREEMCSERESVEAFLAHSFGVCVAADGELAGWCLSEYNSGLRCEVGIETAEPDRRRGLATAMTLALVEQAGVRGYSHVGWHCRANNTSSAATAVRSGLRKVCDYPAFIAFFDPIDNLAVNGNYAWQAGRLDEALQWYARAFAQGEAESWAYWYAAGAAAEAGNRDLAIAYLARALAKGYRVSADQLSQNAWFVGLHDMPAWGQLLASAA